jgi:hypothetical protein
MIYRFTSVLLGASLFCLPSTSCADDWKFHSLDSGYIYTKPASDLDGKWKEEFGVGAPFLTGKNWLVKWNAAYSHSFPKAFNVAPAWTTGATVVYELAQGPVIPGIYTKIKNNLDGLWQQESGFTALSGIGRVGLVFSAGYIFAYPFKSDAAPTWQVSLSAQFRFK